MSGNVIGSQYNLLRDKLLVPLPNVPFESIGTLELDCIELGYWLASQGEREEIDNCNAHDPPSINTKWYTVQWLTDHPQQKLARAEISLVRGKHDKASLKGGPGSQGDWCIRTRLPSRSRGCDLWPGLCESSTLILLPRLCTQSYLPLFFTSLHKEEKL